MRLTKLLRDIKRDYPTYRAMIVRRGRVVHAIAWEPGRVSGFEMFRMLVR
jgi:hypothetical protein